MPKASRRIRFSRLLTAGFAFLAIIAGNATPTQAALVASFFSAGTNDYAYTHTGSATGGTSSLDTTPSTIHGYLAFGPGISASAYGPIAVAITLTSSSTTNDASAVNGSGLQNGFDGKFTAVATQNYSMAGAPTITAGESVMEIDFTDAQVKVALGAKSGQGGASLASTSATTTNILIPFANLLPPESFSLSLSGINPSVSISNGHFNNFKGSDSGNSYATIATVPEPSAMALAGLGALGLIGYGLRRRKAKGV
jgi:hypothetical protein